MSFRMDQFWLRFLHFDWRTAYASYQVVFLVVSLAMGLLLKVPWILRALHPAWTKAAAIDAAMNFAATLTDLVAIPVTAFALVVVCEIQAVGPPGPGWAWPLLVLGMALIVSLARTFAEKVLLKVLFRQSISGIWVFRLYCLNVVALLSGLTALYAWSKPWLLGI